MINLLRLTNFKAASELAVRLAPLTLLTGLNSSGKSTVLQAIAVLRQSVVANSLSAVSFHGEICQLGSVDEVLTEGANSDSISIELTTEHGEWSCEIDAGSKSNVGPVRGATSGLPDCLIAPDFQVLHAERIAPKTLFPRSSELGTKAGLLGGKGEFTIQYLASEQASLFEVPIGRRCPAETLYASKEIMRKAAPTEKLLDQVAGWLQQLSPGVRFSADSIQGADEYRLLFDYVGRAGIRESGRKVRPSNVGFGLTYCLPIVVSCLIAEPGSLLLIENPEAHLHPQGQAAMGELFARTSADGVQVIVETHSDHFLNGVRLAVKRGVIEPETLAVHYFSREIDTGFATVVSPAVLRDGRMSGWPKGFFDQWDNAIDALLEEA